jgi:hypothetical protein
VVISGLVAGDGVSALTQGYDSRNAGARTLAVTGYSVNDGNAGGNYNVVVQAAAGSIAPAPLTIAADDKARSPSPPRPRPHRRRAPTRSSRRDTRRPTTRWRT